MFFVNFGSNYHIAVFLENPQTFPWFSYKVDPYQLQAEL